MFDRDQNGQFLLTFWNIGIVISVKLLPHLFCNNLIFFQYIVNNFQKRNEINTVKLGYNEQLGTDHFCSL